MNLSPNRIVATVLSAAVALAVAAGQAALAGDDPTPTAPAGDTSPVLKVMPPIPLTESSSAASPINIDAPALPDLVAQADGSYALYTRSTHVVVPVQVDLVAAVSPAATPPALVLYVSGNRGRTWVRTQKRAMPSRMLEFDAVNDGVYWCRFAAEAVDSRGDGPAAGAEPQVVVTVDRVNPRVRSLEALPSRPGEPLDVLWQVEDASPLERVSAHATNASGSVVMAASDIRVGPTGRARFRNTQPGLWRIEVMFRDMAGNVTTQQLGTQIDAPRASATSPAVATTVAGGANGEHGHADGSVPMPPSVEGGTSDGGAPAERRLPGGEQIEPSGAIHSRPQIAVLPSRTLRLDYTWDKKHPPDSVSLWVTRDGGRTWQLDQTSDRIDGSFVFRASEDGVYGLKTSRRLGDRNWDIPRIGDAPEREVIVDTQPPRVEWMDPVDEKSGDAASRLPARVGGEVDLVWKVVDLNLADRPIVLEYRPAGQTEWKKIGGPMANTHECQWHPPAGLVGDAELRLWAVDQAGNSAVATLPVFILPPNDPALAPMTSGRDVTKADAQARDEARRAYALATLARLQENWGKAEENLLRATSLDPSYGRAWSDLGGVYLHDGRWEPAVDAYRKATQIMPESTNTRLGLARALAARGQLDEARRTLDTLLGLTPDDADAWLLYGDALWKSGDAAKARQCWLKAMSLGGGEQANLSAIQRRLELKQ